MRFRDSVAHIDKLVSVTGFLDEDRHGHDIVQAAARTLQNTVNLTEHLLDLSFEIVRNVIALAILRRGLAGDPYNGSA